MTRRRFVLGSAAVVALAGTGGYAWFVEPHWLEFVRRPLPVRGLPRSLAGKTLVLLADIHAGLDVAEGYIAESFRRIAALKPDIVVYAGDFTSYHPDIIQQAHRVYTHAPRGVLGTFGVLGNHDYGVGWKDDVLATHLSGGLAAHGIEILRNRSAEVDALQIVGFDDLWAHEFTPAKALADTDRTRPMIALSHNPDTVDLPGWDGFTGWVLSGHTHGGQCRLPYLPPPHLPVVNRRYTSGGFELSGGRSMYISRGLGHLALHARFFVRPEVTVFELTPA
jgi:uncharacterized protein